MPTLFETITNFFGSHKFGFEVQDTAEQAERRKLKSPVPPHDDDGALIANDTALLQGAGSGALSSFLDYGKMVQSENELITKYRDMALHPEVESAIEDILNEMLVLDDEKPSISIVLDELEEIVSKSVLDTIRKEFDRIMELLKFKQSGYNLARYWYIDGRLFINILIDFDKPTEGIKELRYVDPRKIKYVKKYMRSKEERTQQLLHTDFEEYFIYNPAGLTTNNHAWKLAKDTVVYVHSGLVDKNGSIILSNLHKALKYLNQLRMMEDSLVIYRLARAPERRVFQIDVEHLPPHKAQQYVEDIMRRHKNKIVYNPATGEVDASKRFMTMTDDYYIPMRGGKGTSITTLPGGQNLGQIEDIQYFRRALLKSLNIPESRIDGGGQFNLGRASEITRDEVKFQKFISRLRNQFSVLFDQLLRIQLVLKGVVTLTEWERIRDKIRYKYLHDNFFTELKEAEILQNRAALLSAVEPYRGIYFTRRQIMDEVLRMDEDEIERLIEEMKKEAAEGVPPPGGGMAFDPNQNFNGNDQMNLPPPDDNSQEDPNDFAADMNHDPNAPSNVTRFPNRSRKQVSASYEPETNKQTLTEIAPRFKITRDKAKLEDQQMLVEKFKQTERILNISEEDIGIRRIEIYG